MIFSQAASSGVLSYSVSWCWWPPTVRGRGLDSESAAVAAVAEERRSAPQIGTPLGMGVARLVAEVSRRECDSAAARSIAR